MNTMPPPTTERTPRYRVGTTYNSPGKHPKLCTVTDIHTTRNHRGDLVKIQYVATHEFLGQIVTDRELSESTIARNLVAEPAA